VEIIQKIQQVFGDDAVGITQIEEWYNRFKDGRTLGESDARPVGPQQAEMTSSLTKCGLWSCQTGVSPSEKLGRSWGISTGSIHSILTDDLALRRVSVKFVPKLLTMEQKQLHLEVAQDMLDSANRDPEFLIIMAIGDKLWVYGYDPETKAQS